MRKILPKNRVRYLYLSCYFCAFCSKKLYWKIFTKSSIFNSGSPGFGGNSMTDIIFSSWGGEIIENRGNDMQDQASIKQLDLPEYFKQNEKIKALMGWKGLVLRSPEVDIIDLCRAYFEALLDHAKSCDKCNYCKTGWEEMLEVLQDIANGEATEEDLEFMQSAAEAIVSNAKCTIGKSGPAPLFHALKYFADDFSKAISGEKPVATGTYYSKLTAPCVDACPIQLDIPKYVEHIKDAKFAESLTVIRERLPLPGTVGRVCPRPCENHCRRGNLDEPISIKALKRFVADHELSEQKEPQYEAAPSANSGKVAIVGAGPAGMSCAYQLALKGHQVTIFEKLSVTGGMMAVGIPKYALPPDILTNEIKSIEKMGVTIKTGISFGTDITLEDLKAQGFDAVFLGVGLHGSRRLGIEGEDAQGVIPGIEFLRNVALGKEVELGEKVIVVGGGNVAIDVARTLKRMDAGEVTMVCLETREEMPAWEHEINDTLEEEIPIINCFGPSRFLQKDGKVSGIEFKRCTCVFDEQCNFNPQYDENDLQTLAADTIILAIGQSAELDFAREQDIPLLSTGGLQADAVTYQTELKWVFAGGDAVYGPESVVEAAASGKKAAVGIDRFINKLPVEPDDDDYFDQLFKTVKVYDPDEEILKVESKRRFQPSMLPSDVRKSSFDEVEQGLSAQQAVAEAERCLRCYQVATIVV
jgi:NADPH-dependent glutamate synthase beta subunit-like oxidoreductase